MGCEQVVKVGKMARFVCEVGDGQCYGAAKSRELLGKAPIQKRNRTGKELDGAVDKNF